MQMHDYIGYKHQFPSHYSTECSLSCAQHCHTSLRFFVDVLLHILHPKSKMLSVDPRFDGLGRFFDSQHGFYASVTSYNRRPSWYMTFTTLHSATVTLNKNMDYCMNLIYSHLIIYWPTASCNVHFMSDFCYLNPSFCSLSKLLLIQNVRTKAHLIKKGSNYHSGFQHGPFFNVSQQQILWSAF